jgi:GNAT superfamily N-acetyltransferase
MEIFPATAERLADLADLFESNGATRGCWCMWYFLTPEERQEGWHGGNRARFEVFAAEADPPAGLLAYRDGRAMGWCAVGPRSRYPAAIGPRATILKQRDPEEDDLVWLVPCFFVRAGCRRSGTTYALLSAAVELAREYGARAIEGFPIAGEGRSTDYVGREKVFAACGFVPVAQPSPRRVVMRRELSQL